MTKKRVFLSSLQKTLHVDQIIVDTGFKANQASAVLISLRLKGLIKQQAGDFYIRSDV